MGRTHMPSEREAVSKSAVTLWALEVLSSLSLDEVIRRDRFSSAIVDCLQLITNTVEQLVEVFNQLLLPLRELLFPPLQSLPFLYQRAKRLDECIGHECCEFLPVR
jgi:hypothetical protein